MRELNIPFEHIYEQVIKMHLMSERCQTHLNFYFVQNTQEGENNQFKNEAPPLAMVKKIMKLDDEVNSFRTTRLRGSHFYRHQLG